MNLNDDILKSMTTVCDYADSVGKGKSFDPVAKAVKQLRKFVALSTWYGPYDNPFKAYLNCANANNIDTSEVMQFVIPGWLSEWELGADGEGLLDDLLQELAGYTGIVVQMRPAGTGYSQWFARLDKEVE